MLLGSLLGPVHRGSTGVFLLLLVSVKLFGVQGSPSSFLIHQGGYRDLVVCP